MISCSYNEFIDRLNEVYNECKDLPLTKYRIFYMQESLNLIFEEFDINAICNYDIIENKINIKCLDEQSEFLLKLLNVCN